MIDIISTLNSNKATGPFGILVVLLKVLKNFISYLLVILFYCSFASGIVPDHSKVAKVIPVHKKCSPLLVSNYCPISFLSILNKILERLMYNRLIKYFEQSSVFFDQSLDFAPHCRNLSDDLLQFTRHVWERFLNIPSSCSKSG